MTNLRSRILFNTIYGRQERGLMLYGNAAYGLVRDGDGRFVAVQYSVYSQKWQALEFARDDESKALEVLNGKI